MDNSLLRECEPQVLSVNDFAILSGLSLSTIRRYVADGRLPSIQLGGPRCRVLIPRDALLQVAKAESAAPLRATPLAEKKAISGPIPLWLSPNRD